MTMNQCPSIEALQSLLADQPDAPEVERVAAHVEGCPSCQERLEHLTRAANRAQPVAGSRADFLERLRQAGQVRGRQGSFQDALERAQRASADAGISNLMEALEEQRDTDR